MPDMRLVVITQYAENYGERWKQKFGSEYVVAHLSYAELCRLNAQDLARRVAACRDRIEYSNEASRESIIDWILVDKNEFTQFERDQLECDGKITYPAKDLTIMGE